MKRGESTNDPIRIGISACLLGQKVRYDGGHKHDRFLTDTLGTYFEWVPVCPEVEVGMGIPREIIRLERRGSEIRLVAPSNGVDHTRAMRSYAKKRIAALAGEDLCGYILKRNSPSCGMERVAIYGSRGLASRSGRGLFADGLMQQFPNLPIEEEGRLCDPCLRENWIERVFAYRWLRSLWAGRWTIANLVAFHTANKLLLLAHSPKTYQELGRMVASAKSVPRGTLRACYEADFMGALTKLATSGRNANVLQHSVGYFKDALDADSRRELLGHIEDYRVGIVPLVVPLTLIRHYIRRLRVPYLSGQIYFNPHPKELALRNHV